MLERLGEFEAAGDLTTGALIRGRQQPTDSNRAVVSLIDESVAPLVATAIGASPTVAAAAAAAAAPAVTALLDDSRRIANLDDPNEFWVKLRNFGIGGKAFGVDKLGQMFHGATRTKPSNRFTIASRNNKLILDADPVSGEVFIPKLRVNQLSGGGGGGGGGGVATSRVVIIACLGQSNAEGRGRPWSDELDPPDPRMQMWDFPTSTIKTATVPLSSQQQQTGLSIATAIARETLAAEPPGTIVIIVNAGVGATGLVADTAAGVWSVGYAGANQALFPLATAAVDAAKAAAITAYGITPEIRTYWHQGEADSSTSQSAYTAALDTLINAWRTRYGASVPFVLGGMVPEYMEVTTSAKNIRLAHLDTPKRLVRTGYADGIPNAGGSGNTADLVHYAREGVELLGAAMYAAHRRALANVTTAIPVVPQRVSATYVSGKLTVSWSNPFSRVTSYTVEYRVDGGAWTAVAGTTIETTRTKTGLTGSVVEVRVSSTNEVGTSATSTPITALGA